MDESLKKKALAFAAKTVVSAAFLSACGGTESGGPPSDDDVSDDALRSRSACSGQIAKLKAAFPKGDAHWWSSHAAPDPALAGDHGVTQCCESILATRSSADAGPSAAPIEKFRTIGCCSADYDGEADAEKNRVSSACTPWGPPVPPSMDWTPSRRVA
jgi:hypothetical protein